MRQAAWAVGILGLLGGCLQRAEVPRFFQPASAVLDAAGEESLAANTGVAIRLRSVHAAGFLRERVVWRTSEIEYGLYEQRRWIELPEEYVERAVAGAIHGTPGLRLTDDLAAPALAIQLLAFEEVLAPEHVARVSLRAALRDPHRGPLLDRRFAAEEPIADVMPASMARAMGRALDAVATDVAGAVATRAGEHP